MKVMDSIRNQKQQWQITDFEDNNEDGQLFIVVKDSNCRREEIPNAYRAKAPGEKV